MKDNKIDIMCNKLGQMYTALESADMRSVIVNEVMKGIRQIQYDLELLRKCTLDNPDFKWSEVKHDTRSGKGTTCFDEDGHEI